MQTWEPIQDLKPKWEEFASTELAGLKDAWREHRERLKGTKALEKFTKQQARQWSIETGIIENLYHIDRGITQMLVEKGLEASYIPHGTTHKSSEEIIRLLRDHQATLEGLHIFISQQRPLSTSYIKELHQALTRHQQTCDAYDQFGNLQQVALLRGEWKKYPNNPSREDGSVHDYCPPEHIQPEMDRLIELHLHHVEQQVPPEIEAAWLHHRFTQIHPFQDGNGRVARTLASLIFLRDNWFPLTIDRDQRIPYIDALEEADKGDLAPLAELFASNQSKELGKALVLMEEMEKPSIADTVVAIANAVSSHKQMMELLEAETKRKFGETDEEIKKNKEFTTWEGEITQESGKYRHVNFHLTTSSFHYDDDNDDNSYWDHWGPNNRYLRNRFAILIRIEAQVSMPARIFTINAFHFQERSIVEEVQTDYNSEDLSNEYHPNFERIVVSYEREPTTVPLPLSPFQFGDGELPENVLKRYDRWLNEAIIAGLNEWRKQM